LRAPIQALDREVQAVSIILLRRRKHPATVDGCTGDNLSWSSDRR
jgi:hypothetical protein